MLKAANLTNQWLDFLYELARPLLELDFGCETKERNILSFLFWRITVSKEKIILNQRIPLIYSWWNFFPFWMDVSSLNLWFLHRVRKTFLVYICLIDACWGTYNRPYYNSYSYSSSRLAEQLWPVLSKRDLQHFSRPVWRRTQSCAFLGFRALNWNASTV